MFLQQTSDDNQLLDLNEVLVRKDEELDKEAVKDSKSEEEYAFLESENIGNDKKLEQLMEIILRKETLRNKFLQKSNESDSSDHSQDEINWNSDEDVPEQIESKWYDGTLNKVFKDDLKNFQKARELYQLVFNSFEPALDNTAFFYKLRDKIDYKSQQKKTFREMAEMIWMASDFNERKLTLEKYLSSDDLSQHLIAQKLMDIDFLGMLNQISQEGEEQKRMSSLKAYIDAIGDTAIMKLAGQMYFGQMQKKGKELESQGNVYSPGVYHNWGVNLSWVLAHLKKGSHFEVVSEILPNHYRRTENATTEPSALAREICACLKAGYKLEVDGQKITLSPSSNYHPDKCMSNGLPGNGVNASDSEINEIFNGLKVKYSENNTFTFEWQPKVMEESENLIQELAHVMNELDHPISSGMDKLHRQESSTSLSNILSEESHLLTPSRELRLSEVKDQKKAVKTVNHEEDNSQEKKHTQVKKTNKHDK